MSPSLGQRLATLADRFRRYAGSPARLKSTLRLLRQARIVRRSPFFDRDFYLRENPEVADSGADPALHYLLCGRAAGRAPGPDFLPAEYVALNREAAESGLDPLVHYETVGRRNGLRRSFLQDVGKAAFRRPTPEEHQASFAGKVAAVRECAGTGAPVRVVFLVGSASMFPARPLLDAMLRDPRFQARLAVVPDLRWPDRDPEPDRARCRAELAAAYPPNLFLEVERGSDGQWPDILADADIVAYPLPYDFSDFRYNPAWALGRPFLPVHVNYGYYRSVYDRRVMAQRNYALFWKAFFECEETLAEYRAHSLLGGSNGEVTGYVKMDRLAAFPSKPAGARPRVLLCPHHSLEGGLNDALALSNFLRYAEYFQALPKRFPEVDFVFRPHPMLFRVLARDRFWGKERTEAWAARLRANENLAWSDGGDYFAEFASSDAIVQDCGSYLVEYFYTGRPCCYLLKGEADLVKFAPLGVECLRRCHVAYDAESIDSFLRDVVLGGRDALAGERESFRKRIAVNYPHAADAALASIAAALFGNGRG